MKTFFILSCALALVAISLADEAPRRVPWYKRNRMFDKRRIVGGQPADIANFPHMLALLDLSWGGFICGASVVSQHWSLTAAHCVEFGTPPSQINFRGGSTNRLTGGIIFFAERVILHPSYNTNTLDYDIALISTQPDSPFQGPNVQIISISPRCATPCCQTCEGVPVTITGWGRDDNNVIPVNLNQITLPIFNHQRCDEIWWGIGSNFFCVWAGDGQDSCDGDSGSPLFREIGGERFQLGVVSFGSANCGDGSGPSVNARIEDLPIRDWIQATSGL